MIQYVFVHIDIKMTNMFRYTYRICTYLHVFTCIYGIFLVCVCIYSKHTDYIYLYIMSMYMHINIFCQTSFSEFIEEY